MECMKDDDVKKYILKLVGDIVRAEIKKLCSVDAQSVLQKGDADTIKSFTWQILMSELSTHTPVLKCILEATCPKKTQPNFTAVVCVCVALLARSRNRQVSLISKILSLILYAGHSSKEVGSVTIIVCTFLYIPIGPISILQTFNRLQRLNLTMSYRSLIRLLDKVGAKYDEKTKQWRDDLIASLKSSETTVSVTFLCLHYKYGVLVKLFSIGKTIPSTGPSTQSKRISFTRRNRRVR